MGKIVINEISFILPITYSGKELKFNFTKNFYVDFKFDQLKSQNIEIVFTFSFILIFNLKETFIVIKS